MERISAELGAPVAAIALAWVRQQTEVTSTIIGARRVIQLDANIASLDVTLPEEYLTALSKLTEPKLNFPADFLANIAIGWPQGGTTINGVDSPSF
jgi:aryl-alcohol dehydrogenase-like predicted oxidoreductase